MFKRSSKLKRLKKDLKGVNLKYYSHISMRVQVAKKETQIQVHYFDSAYDQEMRDRKKEALAKNVDLRLGSLF